MNNFEIVTVNYNTPDLVERLIKSIRDFSNVSIRIIDGSDNGEKRMETIGVVERNENVSINCFDYNIHHGRGLDYAISSSTFNWVLCVDSEVQLKTGIFDCFTFQLPLEGFPCMVDKDGMSRKDGSITYLHPELLLVKTSWYNNQQHKFIHHGAPAIVLMGGTPPEFKNAMPEELKQYYIRGGRGTVNRYGYNF